MKHQINSISLLVLLLLGAVSFSLTACSDNNSGGGQPEITGVKILSSDTTNYKYDEFYTKAGPGTMLALIGKNLGGALNVYINNQEVTFNTTMNTDHSLIVSVPTEEKRSPMNPLRSPVKIAPTGAVMHRNTPNAMSSAE